VSIIRLFCPNLNTMELGALYRRQYVSIGSINSEEQPISCGVPQGSVLWPLLFLLYLNDFKNSSDLLEFHCFADDCNLFFAHRRISELENLINIHLGYIYRWLSSNKLTLNIDKTNFVIFHPPQKKLRLLRFSFVF
jgi:hypothetical protein